MSWSDKRLGLPFMAHNRPHSLTTTQYSERNVSQNLVRKAYLRKLKTLRKKFFVLYSASAGSGSSHPAHLEYHDSERKWKSGFPPSREIILKDCFNICKKQDSRDSKNKHVLAIYTLDDCLSILFEEEQELSNWFIDLLSQQQGKAEDGKIPRPNYEKLWQVTVRNFKAEDSLNGFVMTGPHRLCVTMDDLKLFPVGSNNAISFPIVSLRSCACNDKQFQLQTGRSSFSGAGTLFINSEDREIAANINGAVLEAMEYKREHRENSYLPRHIHASLKTKEMSDSLSNVHTSPCRPRSESCSEIDKKNLISSSVPKPTHYHHHQQTRQTPATNSVSIFNAGAASRTRTISEGNTHDLIRRPRGKSSQGGQFGSPMSPSPHSCVSSESAGSSNSIDDGDGYFMSAGAGGASGVDRKHPPDPQQTTIYEESSAESWLDPNANKDLSDSPPPSHESSMTTSTPRTQQNAFSHDHNNSTLVISHQRTSSDNIVNYTPIDIVSTRQQYQQQSQQPDYPGGGTNYAVILNNQKQDQISSSDYMAMTPSSSNSGNSSLTRQSSSGITSEQQRLAQLGLTEEEVSSPFTRAAAAAATATATATAVTSPSSQSSYEDQQNLYCSMSPGSSSGAGGQAMATAALATTRKPADNNGGDLYHSMSPSQAIAKKQTNSESEEDQYISMSPTAAKQLASRANMAIPLRPHDDVVLDHDEEDEEDDIVDERRGGGRRSQEYEIMSPVSLDPEKLRRISEEDSQDMSTSSASGFLPPLNGSGGARPKVFSRVIGADGGGRSSSKRSSFCSEVDEEPSSEYVTMDYGLRSIPIPATAGSASGTARGMSPSASSGSVVSGTPSSVDARFPPDFHFESKAVSYLRHDDEDDDDDSNPPLASSNPSLAVKYMEIPKSSTTATSSVSSGKTPPVGNLLPQGASTLGASPNLISRLDNWFRARTGSVPTRPQGSDRRRHRTQSEGEKDSPENEEKDGVLVGSPTSSVKTPTSPVKR